MSNPQPDFTKWTREGLEQFANEAFTTMLQNQDAIEQLRNDNKDLARINRELLTNKDDWK